MTLSELIEAILEGENFLPELETGEIVDLSQDIGWADMVAPPPQRKSNNYNANVPSWWAENGRVLTGDGRGLSQLTMLEDGTLVYPDLGEEWKM